MRTIIALIVLVALAAGGAAGQDLEISVQAPHPETFDTVGGGSSNANMVLDAADRLLVTEPLMVVMTAMPSPTSIQPANLTPRKVALFVGPELQPPMMHPLGAVFVDFAAFPPATALVDSFTNPLDPTFGPLLGRPDNTIALPLSVTFVPSIFPLPPLALQAVAEDVPDSASGLLLSGALRLQVVDPDVTSDPQATGGSLAPDVTDIDPKAPSGLGILRPKGPEAGGNMVTLTGDDLPAQSNWIQFPPQVTFGGEPATGIVVVDRTTLLCTVPPTSFPTAPPSTSACLVDVVVTNNPAVSSTGLPAISPVQYLYETPQAPMIAGDVTPDGHPEGSQTRQVTGSWFLDGLVLRLTSQADPSLTTDIAVPTVPAAGGGMQFPFTTPPFCTGGVDVQVINCDEQVSNTVTFTYHPLPPVFVSAQSSWTAPPELGGVTFPSFVDTGAAANVLTVQDVITAASPLNGAPTVPAALFHPTRTFLDGVLQPGLTPIASNQIQGANQPDDQTGLFRPGLGFKPLRFDNPPCVSPGNQGPISDTVTAVVRDALPPSAGSVYPAIAAAPGGTEAVLEGGNLFSVQPGVTQQDFTVFAGPGGAITTVDVTQLQVPAVKVGNHFSPLVTLDAQDRLRFRVPPAPGPVSGSTSVPVTVYNPDGQEAVVGQDFRYVPPLVTDPQPGLAPCDLDTAFLKAVARGAPTPCDPGLPSGAITFIRNPSPLIDRSRDPMTGTAVIPAGTSYDYVFLLNTRTTGPAGAEPLRFAFNDVQLPAVITFGPGEGGMVPVPSIDPGLPDLQPVPENTTVRVIVKAMGFTRDTSGDIVFDPAENFPLFLESLNDVSVAGMVHLGGDAFMVETLLETDRYRVRVDRTFPPAGAGRGGRGGADFSEGLASLPPPNLGATSLALTGGDGEAPAGRRQTAMPVETGGGGAAGLTPIAFQLGSGSGGGHATPGTPGTAASTAPGPPGADFGNASRTFLNPPAGLPPADPVIFGSTEADMALFASDQAFQTGLLYGGSGGGGGGGGVTIVVPALSYGGRGGHGGGCLVLTANRSVILDEGGLLLAHGEIGQRGIQGFPVPNGPPSIPLCIPGEGGSGSGGTVLALAVADCCFAYGPVAAGPVSGVPLPGGFDLTRPLVDVRGAPAGPHPGLTGLLPVGGGAGGSGRIRFAIDENSPYLADGPGVAGLPTAVACMMGDPCNPSSTCPGLMLPAPQTLCSITPVYFAYP